MLKLEDLNHVEFKMKLTLLVASTMFVVTAFSTLPADCAVPTSLTHDATPRAYISTAEWLPLVKHNGLLIGIGSRRFPVAIRLPAHMHLATRYGQLIIGGSMKPGQYNVEIFFNTRDEARVRQWVHNLPSILPLDQTKVRCSIIRPTPFNVRLFETTDAKAWSYMLVLRTGKTKIICFWLGMPNIYKNQATGTYDDTDDVDLLKLYTDARSPVKHQTRLVSLLVSF